MSLAAAVARVVVTAVIASAFAACGISVVARGAGDGGAVEDSGLAETGVLDASGDGASRDPGPPVVMRLNLAGPAHTGLDYPGQWSASPVPAGGCGPSQYQAATALHGTRDPALFSGEAFGNPMTCALGGGALATGTYRVRLYFAEVYFGPGCAGGGGLGSRVFDVLLEGTTVIKDLDVFGASSGCLASTTSDAGSPIVRTFDVAVTDGMLDIAMPASRNNGKLSAVEVLGPL